MNEVEELNIYFDVLDSKPSSNPKALATFSHA